MKHLLIAFLVIVAAWQLPPRPAGQSADLERAYRANNVGVARLEQFDYEGAAASFRTALHIARLNLGIALLYAGRPAEAAPEARAAAAQLSDSPTAHYVAGLIAKADNNLDEAATAFERVLQLDSRDAGARVQLGQVQLQRRRYDEALKLFQDALAAEPYNVTAAYSVAIALARAGRADEGRPAMQRFEALRDSAYGVTYSQAYLGQGRYGEAVASTGAEPELVDPATPDVTFSEPVDIFQPSAAANADAKSAGGVTLFDADGDGDLDLVATGGDGARLFRNDRGRFTDDTSRALPGSLRAAPARGAVAGDYDNDGRPDLFLVRDAGARLLHQRMDATFEDVTGTLPATTGARSAAFVDVDHDGDLDVVTAGRAVQLARNNGNGTFAEITAAAGLSAAAGGAAGIAPGDFDNRRDVDLLFAGGGTAPSLYRNMRDGSFRDAAADTGLPRTTGAISLAAGDVNKDGYIDLFFGAANAPGTLAMSDGRGAFRTRAAPDGTAAAVAAQFVDYDSDGLLDLLVMLPRGVRLFRNTGADRWVDATVPAQLSAIAPVAGAQFDAMAIGDIDRDGDADFAFRDTVGNVRAWKNSGSRHASLRIALAAHVSNRTGAGAKVEVRAGSLRQMAETSATTPAVGPADVLFGLGARLSADVVRVLWPSGILQAELPTADAAPKPALAMTITELDRKPSSCPYLFTWNGTRFEFVTDFMGGGEMGGWVAPSVWNQPDPDEYVRIRGDQLRARDGRYELRITNELEEALFVDRVQLVAIDHQAGTDVYPNEGLRQPPRAAFRLTATRDAHPPVRASDEHGHDVLPQITEMDRRYPDDFTLLPIRGYAAPHELILDLGATGDDAALLMTGWTDYAFSSDNVAASQSGIEMAAPMLQVQDSSGRWTTVIDDVGFPVGRPQTIAVNLAGKFLSASRQVRIVTSMRIYWDQVQVASVVPARPEVTRIEAAGADLRARGFSREIAPDNREPFGYEYERVSTTSPWKTLAGRYTREGDVRTLVHTVDDMFVVSRPGDEIALSFDAQALPALGGGWTRTFLLYAHGYSKEMNPRSASPDTVGPLPFRAMTRYPYGPDEHYPDTPAHRDYLARYNTRIVNRSVPSIDTVMVRD
jgi:hypothetical protein